MCLSFTRCCKLLPSPSLRTNTAPPICRDKITGQNSQRRHSTMKLTIAQALISMCVSSARRRAELLSCADTRQQLLVYIALARPTANSKVCKLGKRNVNDSSSRWTSVRPSRVVPGKTQPRPASSLLLATPVAGHTHQPHRFVKSLTMSKVLSR